MSRTIAEIYAEIVAEKDGQTALTELAPTADTLDNLLAEAASDSKVAIWRLWAMLVAVAIYTHEKMWDIFKKEVEDIAAAAPAGTPRWYQEQMLNFQYGHDLEYIDGKYRYATEDENARIIKRCAVEERSDGVVIIKVVGENGPLDSTQLAAAQSYASKIKFAGTRLSVLSLSADTLDVDLEIFYDPIIPLATIQADIQAAIDAYIAALPFNARFRLSKLIDAIQLITGVVDIKQNAATNTPSGQSAVAFDVSVIPASGYFEYADPIEDMFTWTSTLQI